MHSLEDVSWALANGRTTSAQLVDAILADETDALFTLKLDQRARAAAKAADLARARGDQRPLLGVPVTVKDNFDIRGIPTTAGSRLLADAAPAAQDAEAVRRLEAAGCVVAGRTNMTEFAFSGLGLNPHFGTPANPRFAGEARITGGSSSGAALSVASGLVAVALGTDTGGSVRIPAALCGLVGFKPTASTIPSSGLLPLSRTLDAIGIIAHRVGDCANLFGALRDDVPAAPEAGTRRLAVVENLVFDDAEPEVCEAIARALGRLVDAGFAVERITVPSLDEIAERMRSGTISAAEAWAWHRPLIEGGGGRHYDPRVLSRILGGRMAGEDGHAGLLAWRADFAASFAAIADRFDAMMWPTVPLVAPRIAALADDDAYWRANGLMLRNSTIANLADGCAISVPCGGHPPVGLTLAAGRGRDDRLLATAMAVEAALAPDQGR
jgi:aspartyl-tRNA(Asn)/glutamyl-tRNA(Gln) amidotransferase subunit A